MLGLRYDDGPSFGWPPSEIMALSLPEIDYFCNILKMAREQYAEQIKKISERYQE